MKKENETIKITLQHLTTLSEQQLLALKGGNGVKDFGRGKDKRKRPTGG